MDSKLNKKTWLDLLLKNNTCENAQGRIWSSKGMWIQLRNVCCTPALYLACGSEYWEYSLCLHLVYWLVDDTDNYTHNWDAM